MRFAGLLLLALASLSAAGCAGKRAEPTNSAQASPPPKVSGGTPEAARTNPAGPNPSPATDAQGDQSRSSSGTGDFEGSYQVGDTTCAVKAIKMAYEVRWAKGSGAMIFFSEEGNRFVSEDTGKGRDAFVFDDDSLKSGKFVRADGREVPVKRIG